MRKGWEQVVAVLGICASGAAYVPLDPDLPAARLRQLADQTRLRTVLTQGPLRGRLAGLDGVAQLAVDDPQPWAGQPDSPPDLAAGNRELAYVIHTSGSTGTPKGVMIDHRGAVNTLLDVNQRFQVRPRDRALALSSLSFDLSVYDIFGMLAAGGSLVLPDHHHHLEPAHWLELVDTAGVTVWNSVPALMRLAADAAEGRPGTPLQGLRLAMLSGDWIPLDLPDRIHRLAPDCDVVSLGGATEASIWSVCYPIGALDAGWTSVPYGTAMANQRLHVLDHELHERPDWVPGDLFIAGDGLAQGYWRDPERTQQSFIEHPRTGERMYRTGDVARCRPDGNLELLGREDLQVKVNGYRVELGEVEHALSGQPGVAACAVAAHGPPRGDKVLAAYYVPEPGASVDPGNLRARLRTVLPDHLVPGTFTALDSLPLTANGKLDRYALRREAAPAVRVGAKPAAVDGLEPPLTEIWQQVLGLPAIDRHDSFFALGGTSLVAIRLIDRLEAALDIKIPLVGLFEAPTIAELAAAITAAGTAGHEPAASGGPHLTVDDEGRHQPFPLTSVQEAYWLGRRPGLQLGGVATHSYVELDVAGIDLPRLRDALQRLVDRHDSLRAVVQPDGTQRVLADPVRVDVPVRDLRNHQPADAEVELQRVRARMSSQIRDCGQWPLFDVTATLLTDERTRLHISLDLMMVDAHSVQILQRELMALYEDEAVALPSLGCTFRDYLLAVVAQRDSPAHREAERYWRGRLAALPGPPPLPTRSGATHGAGGRFERLVATLPAREWSRLQERGADRNLTPSGLLCAAFADVLALWSQRGRFTLNLTVFNRQPLHPDVDHLVGDFTSTTLLAVDAAAPTFEQRAGRLQQQLLRDLQHRQLNGVEVTRLLRRDPRRRNQAVAPIVFTSMLLPEHLAPAPTSAWDAELVYSVSQTPQVLLDYQVSELDGALFLTWDHVAEEFPEGMVSEMFTAYQRLLRSLVDDGGYWKAGRSWTR